MYLLDNILSDIYQFLKIPPGKNSIVRIHSKKLESLGEISFPLNIDNWFHLIDKRKQDVKTILEYAGVSLETSELDTSKLEKESEGWCIKFRKVRIEENNVHIHLERSNMFRRTIEQCLTMKQDYGAWNKCSRIEAIINIEGYSKNDKELSLSNLRMILLQKVIENLMKFQLNNGQTDITNISINLGFQYHNGNHVLCGSVINENGSKDTITSAEDLYKKRSTDMRLMAEHKYGLRIKSKDSWNEYFKKLGNAAVSVELLQNKPHKNVKVALNNLSSSNKGASFIFYNCARLSALFREFESKISNKVYPELIPLSDVDFSLLNQPEEWELLYVYILQYPMLIKSCIDDIETGIVNPHYLVSFLSNLCSIFSVYYRRIRILVEPKPHLLPTLHARIYLLKSLENVFHKTLRLLGIDPIREM